jgi:hypothetical protein
MQDITSNGQQRNEKNSNKRKTLHGASKVGLVFARTPPPLLRTGQRDVGGRVLSIGQE